MKFRGFPRTPCRRLVDWNGSRSQLRECFEISPFACICVPTLSLCVLPYVEQRGCHRHYLKKKGVKWVTKKSWWDKSCVRGRKRCQFPLVRLFLLLEFFFDGNFQSAGRLVVLLLECIVMMVLCTCTHMCRRKKKPVELKMRLSKTIQRHESKKQTKRINPCKSCKKMLSKQTPNALKISFQGRC